MTHTGNKYEETTLESVRIFDGKVISLHVDTVRLPNGETAKREIVRHPGAVAVIAIAEDRLLVVDQYRKPIGRNQVEIPAGKLEPGEVPEEAAKRELEEETGYACGSLKLLSSFATSPGFADEIIHLFVAEGLTKGQANPDEDEFLDCEAISFEDAHQYIREGRIGDAKTLMALYAWQLYRMTGTWS